MSIPVVCPACAAKLNAPDSAAGKKVKCPKCQAAMVVPAPKAGAPAFEVVEEEPAAKPAPRPKVKAVVEDDDRPRKKRVAAEVEDEAPRRKRRADDDEEDDRPRKNKKKEAAGNPMLVRNIIGGVVLLVLLGVAGWVYYDKLGKKDDDTAGTSGATPPADRNLFPGGTGGPDRPRPGGDSGGQAVWTPDPALANELELKGEAGGYQILLPERFAPVPSPVALPPNIQQGTWVSKTAEGEPAAIISLATFSDAGMVGEANKNMRQTLVNYSAGVTDSSGIKIENRGPTETGGVNGLRFTRFVFSGTTPTGSVMKGVVYGAVDGDRVVTLIGMGFGAAAEVEIKRLESVAATTRKQ